MKLLFLFIGLLCCATGLLFRRNAGQKIKSNIWLALGIVLIIANIFYLWLGFIRASIVIIIMINTLYYKGEKWFNSNDMENDNLKAGFGVIAGILLLMFLSFSGKNLPSVTLNNDVIKMEGRYGRIINITDIQSTDTINIIPRLGIRRGGSATNSSFIGNFEMENEKMMAKLCVYRDNPPYIKIRMNDNSLFILNFKEPEETVEFYDRLRNITNK
ncbi:MAG: hypothetical protein LBV47_02355 [Bacteroidales bacterium]|jgi:hypothetical protein|nr:hypothetical protein [Bacteroidales bacterium]